MKNVKTPIQKIQRDGLSMPGTFGGPLRCSGHGGAGCGASLAPVTSSGSSTAALQRSRSAVTSRWASSAWPASLSGSGCQAPSTARSSGSARSRGAGALRRSAVRRRRGLSTPSRRSVWALSARSAISDMAATASSARPASSSSISCSASVRTSTHDGVARVAAHPQQEHAQHAGPAQHADRRAPVRVVRRAPRGVPGRSPALRGQPAHGADAAAHEREPAPGGRQEQYRRGHAGGGGERVVVAAVDPERVDDADHRSRHADGRQQDPGHRQQPPPEHPAQARHGERLERAAELVQLAAGEADVPVQLVARDAARLGRLEAPVQLRRALGLQRVERLGHERCRHFLRSTRSGVKSVAWMGGWSCSG